MKIINLECDDGYIKEGQLVSFQNEIYEYQFGQRHSMPVYIIGYDGSDDWKRRHVQKQILLRAVAQDGTRGDSYLLNKYFDGHWSQPQNIEKLIAAR